MPLHDLPHFRQPREKLLSRGGDGVSDAELLAILLRTGTQQLDALQLAQKILQKQTLGHFLNLPTKTLLTYDGLGPAKVMLLKAVLVVAERLTELDHNPAISNARDVALLAQPVARYQQEHLLALYLDARNRVIIQKTLSIGTVNSSLIHAREVFAPAIDHRAVSLILVHNHPSGDLEPSADDIQTTEKLVDVGELMDIRVIDHIIIGKQGWFSFREHQLV